MLHIKPVLILSLTATLISCKPTLRTEPAVLWTDNPAFASYAELFNSTHENSKVVVVYKEQPARSLPPAKDEQIPDLIAGSWLKNSLTRKNFRPLDYMFQEKSLDKRSFYKKIIEYGEINDKQYLVPVSFNLPAVIFDRQNEFRLSSDHSLSLDEIRITAGEFNKSEKNDAFTAMGYAPSWNPEFIYLAAKLNSAEFHEKGKSFEANENALQKTIIQMQNWTKTANRDTSTEQNFQFRYLYMPEYRQVTSDRCLFALVTSNRLFTLTDTQTENISFRWVSENNRIFVEDSIITMGIYRQAKHSAQAEEFLSWIMKEETQKELIERTERMKLNTASFGIAGGFSSVRNVTEKYYPAYYRQLLGNLPPEGALLLPKILPFRWESLKKNVVIPYLEDSIKTDSTKEVQSLESRIADWTKQFY